MTTATVAKDILSFCTKCKMDLNHVICAMNGDQVKRVKCHTCGSEHNFRAPKGVTEPGGAGDAPPSLKKPRKKAEKAESAPVEDEWVKLMQLHQNSPVKVYSTKSQFALGDRVKHPTFGDGIVMKHVHPNKIEIIFESDLKLLIHTPT